MVDPNMILKQFFTPRQNAHHKGGLGLFVYPSIVLVMFIGALTGCSNTTSNSDDARFKNYASQSIAALSPDLGGNGPATSGNEWSIVLTTIASGRMDHASAMLEAIQNQGGLPQAYIAKRADGLAIVYGRYSGSNDPRSKTDLKRIRSMVIDGGTPYVGAFFAAPSGEALAGSNPDFDLRNVKGRMGDRAAYTLQIGVYGPDDYSDPTPRELAEYRKTAEQAVIRLRNEGEQAFYYHAATRSMVTIGVFSRDDHDATMTPPLESSALRAAREKFPHNTLNGMGIRETIRTEQGKAKRMQRSRLVEIPKR